MALKKDLLFVVVQLHFGEPLQVVGMMESFVVGYVFVKDAIEDEDTVGVDKQNRIQVRIVCVGFAAQMSNIVAAEFGFVLVHVEMEYNLEIFVVALLFVAELLWDVGMMRPFAVEQALVEDMGGGNGQYGIHRFSAQVVHLVAVAFGYDFFLDVARAEHCTI